MDSASTENQKEQDSLCIPGCISLGMKRKENNTYPFTCFVSYFIFFTSLFLLSVLPAQPLFAQNILSRKISLNAHKKTVAEALKEIEKKGQFYFSYNNNILKADSIVSISVHDCSIEQLLDKLFDKKYEYRERDNHLILHPASLSQQNYISGRVVDASTGEPVSYATVYDRQQLISTMTDEKGFFQLQLKDKRQAVNINISKVSYADTMVRLSGAPSQAPRISIQPISYTLDSVVISGVERTWLAKRFLSTKQTMNSLNLSHFFSGQSFQFSLTPGLGSHGKMGAQVINKFSFNILGGYTAGVNGLEIGSLFNIVKQDVQYLQIAGLFNVTGGSMYGVQIGGLHNNVLNNINGIQIGGLSNVVRQHGHGIQIAGLYNQASGIKGIQVSGLCNINTQYMKGVQIGGLANRNQTISGIQVAGISNINTGSVNGVQIAGLMNINTGVSEGVQIAGFFNKATKVKGIQVGIVNITDTSEGYAIGLVNIVHNGYHKLSVSASEIQDLNLSYKSGNSRLYSILSGGMQLNFAQKAFSAGYGLGSDRKLGKGFYINPQLMHLYFFTGNWEAQNLVERLELNLKYRLGKHILIYGGPAFSILYYKPTMDKPGYRSSFATNYPAISFSPRVKGWIGWNMGLDLW